MAFPGECERGASCRFSHEAGGEGGNNYFGSGYRRNNGGKSGVCFAFQRGECDRGDSCRFSHGNSGRKFACHIFQLLDVLDFSPPVIFFFKITAVAPTLALVVARLASAMLSNVASAIAVILADSTTSLAMVRQNN